MSAAALRMFGLGGAALFRCLRTFFAIDGFYKDGLGAIVHALQNQRLLETQ
ncbi:MAG: hypothetical protein ACJ74W_01240 [Pyrinomonadaceae bacterium]